MVINSQGLGAHPNLPGLRLAQYHLFLLLEHRLHSFFSEASHLSPKAGTLASCVETPGSERVPLPKQKRKCSNASR